jgi:hypothetical protein
MRHCVCAGSNDARSDKMKRLSTKSLIAIAASMMFAVVAASAPSTPTPGPEAAGQQLAQYCAPHEDGGIESQDFFC